MPETISLSLAEKAARFRALHGGPSAGRGAPAPGAGPGLLVLPNAWDAASARIVEAAGFPAIATTSAGVVFSLGYRDGDTLHNPDILTLQLTPFPTFLTAPNDTTKLAWPAGLNSLLEADG